MKSKKVFLLLNGSPPTIVPNISNYDVICATDGAYQYLKENNITIGIITDGRSIQQRSKLEALGLYEYTNQVVISEEIGSEKPNLKNY